MPFKWIVRLPQNQLPLRPEEVRVVLAAPGSVGPRQRLTTVLAAGSLLAVGARPGPLPRAAQLAPASPLTVTNLNPSGPGSLLQAVQAST